MRIAILGYGKMGKEIEKIALERKHEIVLKIDIDNISDLSDENLQRADVAIDFSAPGGAYDNIMKCFEANIPIVCGTTGWHDRVKEVTEYCRKNSKTFFYASNYSIGVNLFFRVNKYLAGLMNKFPDYNVSITETHHIHKIDAPSGTAITTAEGILEKLDRKKKWELGNESGPDVIRINAVREGEIPGIHEVKYISDIDFLEIRHSAFSRKGFALGAVLAAEFIIGKTGFYTMDNLLNAE